MTGVASAFRLSPFIGGAVFVLLVGGLAIQNTSLRAANEELIETLGQVKAANAAHKLALDALRAESAFADEAARGAARENDKLRGALRGLQHTLREAARHETVLDSRVHPDVADALRMQWQTASGDASGYCSCGPSGVVDARKNAAVAAGGDCAVCDSWRGLTYGDVVEWTGLLLEHAGLERNDKAALRSWAEGAGR